MWQSTPVIKEISDMITDSNNEGILLVISESEILKNSQAAITLRGLAEKLVDEICPPVELTTCTARIAEQIAKLNN